MSIETSFAPVAAATGAPVSLSMQRLWLTGQVLAAGARLVVEHVFRSDEDQALEAIYAFPLPRDAALRSFRISGEGFEAHSELKETAAAVEAYEDGVARGSLATLAREYADGVVNLTVGNIRPKETVTVRLEILCGVELRDDGFRFRFPFTLAPGYHARAKAASAASGEGEMELPAGEFGDVILPGFREDASALHQVGFDLTIASQLPLDEVGSPSHAVRVRQAADRPARVMLATEKDVPNRDLVLDARFQAVAPQVLAGRDQKGVGRFAAIVPSSSFGALQAAPRRVVILVDRSGSMQGAALAQARKAIEACLGALSETDSFGLVAFDDAVEELQGRLVPGTREWRERAHEFLAAIGARGGTELVNGFLAAAKMLEGGGGDVLILTDGQVFGTGQILAEARAAGVRLHCLGIGSASEDRFLTLLARETGGVSRFVTPRERVDLSAVDLFASIGRPLVSGLKAGGNIQPAPPPCVFAGTPVLLFGEADDAIELSWDGGQLKLPVAFENNGIAETVWLLQGARLIADWESRRQSTETPAPPLEKRQQDRVAGRLRALSQTYGLASREMSLVAVVTRSGDRLGELPQTRVVPVGMAQDTEFGAYFPAATSHGTMHAPAGPPAIAGCGMAAFSAPQAEAAPSASPADHRAVPMFERAMNLLTKPKRAMEPPADRDRLGETAEDFLLSLASRMDSDGGMPGENGEARALATAVAALAFLSQGHTPARGAFRSHVARLLKFLESLAGLTPRHQEAIAAVIELARKGAPPAGDWVALARVSTDRWKEVEEEVLGGGVSVRR